MCETPEKMQVELNNEAWSRKIIWSSSVDCFGVPYL